MDSSMERYSRLASSSLDEWLNLDAFEDDEPQPQQQQYQQQHQQLFQHPQQFVNANGYRVPSEIITQIMTFLPAQDQRTCLMVSRWFHAHAIEHVLKTIHIRLSGWALEESFDWMRTPKTKNASWELLFHCMFDQWYGKRVKHVVVDNEVHLGNAWAQNVDLSNSCLVHAFHVMPRVSRLTWCAEVKLCRPIFDAFPALQELEFALPLTIPDDYETWNFSKLTSLAFTYTPAWQSYCSMIEMQECIVDMVKMMRQRKSQKLKIPFFAWVYAKQHLEQHGIACEVWMDMTGQALARREMEELEERYWVMRNAYPGMHYSSVLDELSGGARSRNMVTHNL